MRTTWFLVRRFLFSRQKKSFRSSVLLISTLGVTLASCLVLVSLGVLFGYQKVYHDAVLNFSAHVVITHQSGLGQTEQNKIQKVLNQIRTEKNLDFISSPYQFFESLVPAKEGMQTVIFKGFDFGKLKSMYPLDYEPFTKDIVSLDPAKIYVGKDLLQLQPQIQKNQKLKFIQLKNPKGDTQPKIKSLNVLGTFSSGYYDFDSRFVFLPLKDMQDLFFTGSDLVSGFEIRMADIQQVRQLTDELWIRLGNDYDIITWDKLNDSLFEALKLDRTVVFAVSFLVLLIACLNIFGFNFLFFMERKREFVILSALGFSVARLRRLLAVLSFFLGGLATVLGAALSLGVLFYLQCVGVALDPTIYYVEKIPVAFHWLWFVMFLGIAVVLCYITSVLAGWVVIVRRMTQSLAATT